MEIQCLRWKTFGEFIGYIGGENLIWAELDEMPSSYADILKYEFPSGYIKNHEELARRIDEYNRTNVIAPPGWTERQLSLPNQNSLVIYDDNTSYSIEDFIINYISDLHLDHKIEQMLKEDVNPEETGQDRGKVYDKVLGYIYDTVYSLGVDRRENVFHYTLIAGDTSFRRKIVELAYNYLELISLNKKEVIAVLGNHEYWEYDGSGTLEEYVHNYKEGINATILQNEVLLMEWNPKGNWRRRYTHLTDRILTYDEIMTSSNKELRPMFEKSLITILGGTGFSGYDEQFNANSGMYNGAIDREEEIRQTKIFESLYKRVRDVASDLRVIVLTHMPKQGWSRDPYVPGWIYVNGHTHMNYISDENGATIYSDNQIGYVRDKDQIRLKRFTLQYGYDPFKDYGNGIYEVDKERFIEFHHGHGITCEMNRKGTIWMVKYEGYYMFLFENEKGTLYVMKGGALKKAEHKDVNYYAENIPRYKEAIESFLGPYTSLQKKVSAAIRAINGTGRIHGSIVDIDYYSHIYVNPFDGTITPYYATDKKDKLVYPNVPALIKEKCPTIFKKYLNMKKEEIETIDPHSLILVSGDLADVKAEKYKGEEMYTYSILIYGLQRIANSHLIRIWNDDILKMDAKEYFSKHIDEYLLETKDEN